MFALQWISVAAKPFVQGAGVKVIFASMTGDVLLDVLVAALFTMLCYSSLAVVLLVATLASLHVIALPVALGLVLGANLGSGLLGMLSTMKSPPEARRVTLGNFLFKLIGCAIAIPLLAARRRLDQRAGSRPRARSGAVPPGIQRARWRCCSSSGPNGLPASRSACFPPSPPRTTRRRRGISTRRRSARPRWPLPTRRARRCASATSSRTC